MKWSLTITASSARISIRDCADAGQFNTLLQNLGEDAYNSAYIPEEDESLEMGGM